MKDLSVSKPRQRAPEIIGVDPNLSKEEIVHEVLKQNDVLEGTSVVLRTCFEGKQGHYAILSIDDDSYERLTVPEYLNFGWCQADFQSNRRQLVCYKCWRYDHTRTVCRSA